MDFIKKNLYAVAVAGVTLLFTAVLLGLFFSSTQKVKALGSRANEIQTQEEQFLKLQYRLDAKNVKIAQDGAKLAEVASQEFQHKITKRFNAINPSAEGISITFKSDMQRRCDGINQSMKVNGIEGNLGNLGFDYIYEPTLIPTKPQIQSVLKQLTIVEEFIDILNQAKVHQLATLKLRSGDVRKLVMLDRPRYQYFEYDLDVRGDVETIQRLIQGLYNSRYCFAIRFLSLEATADSIPGAGVAGVNTGTGLGAPGTRPTPGGPGLPGGGMLAPPTSPSPFGPGPIGPGATGGTRGGARPPVTPTPAPAVTSPEVAATVKLAERTKDDRLLVKDVTTLRAVMIVDYIEFKGE